uniref:Uncharacterized protein n=1 Tax=Rhabditophanes sp. KR3021 TaxID=114890 RepID=A0AC35U1H4_9BILA
MHPSQSSIVTDAIWPVTRSHNFCNYQSQTADQPMSHAPSRLFHFLNPYTSPTFLSQQNALGSSGASSVVSLGVVPYAAAKFLHGAIQLRRLDSGSGNVSVRISPRQHTDIGPTSGNEDVFCVVPVLAKDVPERN